MYKWLDSALDYGITEREFWDMTINELIRAIESKKRLLRIEAKERAAADYILADLIGRSISRLYNSANTYPDISDVYPALFDDQEAKEAKQARQDEISALRFTQFANAFNKRFKEAQE